MEPTKRKPSDAINIHHVSDAVGWDLPTFFAREVYADEIVARHPATADQNVEIALVLQSLREEIDRALATTRGDETVIYFKHFRKTSAKVTKAKPVELKCSLFENPDYGVIWGLIEFAE